MYGRPDLNTVPITMTNHFINVGLHQPRTTQHMATALPTGNASLHAPMAISKCHKRRYLLVMCAGTDLQRGTGDGRDPHPARARCPRPGPHPQNGPAIAASPRASHRQRDCAASPASASATAACTSRGTCAAWRPAGLRHCRSTAPCPSPIPCPSTSPRSAPACFIRSPVQRGASLGITDDGPAPLTHPLSCNISKVRPACCIWVQYSVVHALEAQMMVPRPSRTPCLSASPRSDPDCCYLG